MVAISQTLSSMDTMSETIKNLDSIFNNSAISQAAMILNAIQPQISFWNDWLNNNRQIFKFYEDSNAFWKNVRERYNISKKKALIGLSVQVRIHLLFITLYPYVKVILRVNGEILTMSFMIISWRMIVKI